MKPRKSADGVGTFPRRSYDVYGSAARIRAMLGDLLGPSRFVAPLAFAWVLRMLLYFAALGGVHLPPGWAGMSSLTLAWLTLLLNPVDLTLESRMANLPLLVIRPPVGVLGRMPAATRVVAAGGIAIISAPLALLYAQLPEAAQAIDQTTLHLSQAVVWVVIGVGWYRSRRRRRGR